MRMLLISVVAVASLCAVARADELVLQDGRTFTGTVTVKDEVVLVQMSYGTLSFSRDQVQRIDIKDTPLEQYNKRLAKIDAKDADGLYTLALWARGHALSPQADELLAKVLQINPDHAGARKVSGFARIDERWVDFKSGMELGLGKLEAGKYDSIIRDVVPALEPIAAKDDWPAVRELLGDAQLRSKDFSAATATFTELAAKTSGALSGRYAAIVDVLSANHDGMYVLVEPYPPESALLGTSTKTLPAGPASLAAPLVLEAALRDKAKQEIKTGREIMDAATKIEPTDPDGAMVKYLQAGKAFDRADAMVADIARSYRIEIARRRITAIRKDADADAKKFDAALATLGKKDMTAQAYRSMVQRLMHNIDSVRESLKGVIDIAKPYPRELVLEVEWAQQDLKKIEAMRVILASELDAKD
jgi:tetratricopeptide (TPR) repeat protein